MKKLFTIIAVLFIFHLSYADTGNFSEKEKAIIYTNSLQVLQAYESLINDIGVNVVNDIEKAKSGAEGLIELFINRQVLVYNDLDPSHKLSPFYEIETYTSNLILWYPDGIKVGLNLENAKVGNIMQHENNVFSLDILTNRMVNGNYLNKTLNNSQEDLTFRIAFSKNGNSFDNFKIVGVREAESNNMIDYSKALKEVNSEDLSEDELIKVYDGIKTVLGDYNNYLALLGDPDEFEDDKVFYRESFNKLFQSDEVKIYNDINPNPEKSLIDVANYLPQYEENFPVGIKNISVNIDSAEFGKVIKTEDGNFFSYAYADKFFSGSFRGKDAFSEMFPLAFKVSFEKSGKAYTNFKIVSIDISGSGFFASDSEQEMEMPSMQIKPVTRKGLSITATASYGLSYIQDENLSSVTLASNNHEWSLKNDYGLSIGVQARYFLTENIALGAGVGYSSYKASFALNGDFVEDELSTDPNDDLFYKNVIASIDSVVSLNYISIPIYASYISGKPGKLGFYVDAGVDISYLLSSSYELTGNYQYKGLYTDFPENNELEVLGYYNRQNINEKGDTDVSSLNISLYASAGVNIPFGYYSSLLIGPEFLIGFTDVMSDRTEYKDIFGNISDNQPTKTQRIGLKIAFIYKW